MTVWNSQSDKNLNIQAGRGIAILMVAVFHFTFQWSGQYFYGRFVSNDFFKIFTLGVQLFFMISGYVIFKTIENTITLQRFLFKRMKRLIPALCIIAPILFLIQKLVIVKNFPNLDLKDLLISIFMINPTYLSYIFHAEFHFVTGVMWTLTYELTFYLLIGIIYYCISKKFVFEIFFVATNLFLIFNYAFLYYTNSIGKGFSNSQVAYPSLEYLLQQSGLLHLCWFAIGMWFYKYEGYRPNTYQLN